jgi:hypothetical protein
MSGQWPPEWEDPEEESSAEADQLDTEAEARLSEVAAYLASVPVPALPDAVEARINAALAAEAAGSHGLGPAPARARVRRHSVRRHSGDGGGSRRSFLRRPVVAVASLVICLLLAGLGFTLTRGSTPQTESSAASSSAAGSSFAAGSGSAGSRAAGIAPAAPAASAAESGPQYAGPASSFLVTASGTRYKRATLSEQVRTRLTALGSPRASIPAASASSASAGAAVSAAPSAALRGCVLHLMGDVPPRLVDRATYQGEPAYVIASSTRVWVVGLGCTATKTELIVSVALAGLPGNLRALVSVEQ